MADSSSRSSRDLSSGSGRPEGSREASTSAHDSDRDSTQHMAQGRSNTMSSCLTASRPSLLHLNASEEVDPPSYHTSTPLNEPSLETAAEGKTEAGGTIATTSNTKTKTNSRPASSSGSGGMVSPENPPSTPERQQTSNATSANPTKAASFEQLKQRYLKELEYMLVEFRKLEKQLLGAKAATRETAGSKERREKLHSFIVHLDETIQQIQAGCKASSSDAATTDSASDEETVGKLEEHILANLLPVKVRLKKQLAAQHGAKHNPATMPTRGTMNASVAGAATAAVDKETKAAFVPAKKPTDSHFGKPLAGGGSSLTQKLHGPTLGSAKSKPKASNKVLYAGMAIGSDQIESSVNAATSVHKFIIQDPALLELQKLQQNQDDFFSDMNPDLILSEKLTSIPEAPVLPNDDAMEQLRLRLIRKKKRRRQKKRQLLQKQKLQTEPANKKRKQAAAVGPKKRGPRAVEYICALCNEVYQSSCEYNTWWALSQQECPKCRKGQIPRIDISAPSNAIEYHPALLAHADDGTGATTAPVESMQIATASKTDDVASEDSDSLGSDLTDEDWDDLDSDEDLQGSDLSDDEPLVGMSSAELAEREQFGAEYTGPTCDDTEASRLLVLMGHAATCPCEHKSAKHRDVCRGAKYMMLHVRDCPGTTSLFDVCPFPWCRKVKHLLHHLVTCQEQEYCSICSPTDLTPSFLALRGLNEHRFKKRREQLSLNVNVSSKGPAKVGANAVSVEHKSVAEAKSDHLPVHEAYSDFLASFDGGDGHKPEAKPIASADIEVSLSSASRKDSVTVKTEVVDDSEVKVSESTEEVRAQVNDSSPSEVGSNDQVAADDSLSEPQVREVLLDDQSIGSHAIPNSILAEGTRNEASLSNTSIVSASTSARNSTQSEVS